MCCFHGPTVIYSNHTARIRFRYHNRIFPILLPFSYHSLTYSVIQYSDIFHHSPTILLPYSDYGDLQVFLKQIRPKDEPVEAVPTAPNLADYVIIFISWIFAICLPGLHQVIIAPAYYQHTICLLSAYYPYTIAAYRHFLLLIS